MLWHYLVNIVRMFLKIASWIAERGNRGMEVTELAVGGESGKELTKGKRNMKKEKWGTTRDFS